MSLATASNGPEAKKFRFDLPTQVVVNEFDFNNKNGKMDVKSEICDVTSNNVDGVENGLDLRSTEKLSPTNSTSNSYKCEALSPSPSLSQDSSTNDTNNFNNNMSNNSNFEFPFAMLFQQANALMKSMSKEELKAAILAQSRGPAPVVPPTPPAPIPGALAVAASPAAQLFSEDDWSWHRNPAAAIRSGGTNKQTPVWKYFVYNKAENLSRCIIGDCTYMLKGPHTSTLACHLKKHPAEYAEFQKLKLKFQQEYTRERNAGQLNGSIKTSQPSSAESSARHTPTSTMNNQMNVFKKADTPTNVNSIFSGSNKSLFPGQKSQSKPSSMTDILNILSARANANASPQLKQEEPMNHGKESDSSPVTSIPPILPFSHMMGNQKNNAFLLNFIKHHNANVINTLNNNNNITNNNNNNNTVINSNNNSSKYQSHNQQQQHQHQQHLQQMQKVKQQNHQQQSIEIDRKWLKQDKKQKEMEIKLSLALSTAQLPLTLINNPFFRDFIETAQPKFSIPYDTQHIDEVIHQQYMKTIQAVKIQLATTPKISLIIDVLKLNSKQWEIDENVDISTNNIKNHKEEPIIRLCISASYYSITSQSMEIVLLGIRQPNMDIDPDDGIKNCIEQIMSEYDISWERISRIVTTGLDNIGSSDKLFDKQLEPYNQKLTLSLINVFDTDPLIIEIKKLFYNMVYTFSENHEMVSQLMKEIGKTDPIPLNEPFINLAEYVLKIKNLFLRVCNYDQYYGTIPLLNNEQWIQLEAVVNLLSLFKKYMRVEQDGNYTTIDRVVPSLMQLKLCLDRDYSVLGELPQKLYNDLSNRANYILDMNSDNFDGSFIQATALNPQLAMLLDDAQLNYAKNSIEKMLSERIKQSEEYTNKKLNRNSCGVDALLAAVVERKNSNGSSPTLSPASSTTSEINNHSTASSLYPDLLQVANQRRKTMNDRQNNGKNLFAEAVVQSYFDDLLKTDTSSPNYTSSNITAVPPLQYWQMSSSKCQQLSDIAIELLTVPSSTVSIERIFSFENISQNLYGSYLLRSLEDSQRVERDSILRFNRNFIPKNI